MVLHLDDYWVWDFWLAPRQEPASPFHVFFLQAPRSISDPELRHNAATIGHATSPDLREWTYAGTCFGPGELGSWDDFTIWTGSVIRESNHWLMFYTGRCQAEEGRMQRIGLATSTDLANWTRHPGNPVVEADPRWYQADPEYRIDCRDPWVTRDHDRWLMYFTATGLHNSRERNGVIGLAESDDLIAWHVLPPTAAPGLFGEMEVPQPLVDGEDIYLLFCTAKHGHETGKPTSSWNGTHYLKGHSLTGPFEIAPYPPLFADEVGNRYAARVVDDPWLGRFLIAWQRWDEHGNFAGDLTDPIPIHITPERLLQQGSS